MFLTTDKCF